MNTSNENMLLGLEDCERLTIEEVQSYYRKHLNPSIEKILSSFSFGNEIIASAEGVWIYTLNGRKILDVTGGAGVLNLGHNPIEILNARIEFQNKKRMEVHKSFFNQYMAGLAYNLAQILPGKLNNSFFCNSGAEAVEGALKIAYKYHQGKRKVILHADIAFHGKLIASGSLTSYFNKRFQFQETIEKDVFEYDNLNSLEEKFKQHKNNIYAVIIEPFSASHLKGPSDNFMSRLRELCDQSGALLIFDEVYTGWFKTGPLFSFMNTNVLPDIVTISKTLGGGKASISAYVATEKITLKAYGHLKDALLHTTTYNGFAEECATAIVSLNLLCKDQEKTKSTVLEIEKKLVTRLSTLKEKFPGQIESIAGRGALFGIYFKIRSSAMITIFEQLPPGFDSNGEFIEKVCIAAIVDKMYDAYGVHCLFMTSGRPALLISPSFCIKSEEIDFCIDSLEKILNEGIFIAVKDFVTKKVLKLFK